MSLARILFVDDEPSIRATLAAILRHKDYDVTVAATVPEALDFITQQQFDVLISDLNIGEPGDGFTVVSAMRRTQPKAITFILTGYPDFESALVALRNQVDDYIIKPANIESLVNNISQRLATGSGARVPPATRRASDILRERTEPIIQEWLQRVDENPELEKIKLSNEERADHLPALIRELADRIDARRDSPDMSAVEAATLHGKQRYHQGYTIPLIVAEARLLQKSVSANLQANLLSIDISTLIGDLIQIGESLTAELEESIRSFQYEERLARNSR
jgi:DNA-binding response OmpR family regulator